MQHRSRRRISVVATVAVLVVALAGCAKDDPAGPISAQAAATTTKPPTIQGDWADTGYLVADAKGPKVTLYTDPADDKVNPYKASIDNPTWEGLPAVFLVLEDKGDWLKVRVSSRPNGMTAWIKRSEVATRRVPNHVVVQVGARKATVYHGDRVLMQATVAVGTDRTPTPLGEFFVDGVVDVPNDGGAYGAFQISVAGFSDALKSFGGGPGQIAMHGTNRPNLLGQAVSNGCVRMNNDDITKMVDLAPTGTPVAIVA